VSRLVALTIVAAVLLLGQRTAAQQNLTGSLLSRYFDALRLEAGIPGLSAVVLQDGNFIWEGSFGYQDVESATPPTRFTPYALGSLSQILGSTLLLKTCADEQFRSLSEPVTNWIPQFQETTATLTDLLSHRQLEFNTYTYQYNPGRFSFLTDIIKACGGGEPYQQQLAKDLFAGLSDSVPGTAVAARTPEDVEQFGNETLDHYAHVLSRMATPYRVDVRGRPTRSELPPTRADASAGAVMSAYDLALFDARLSSDSPLVDTPLRPETRQQAWSRPSAHLPTGLGWFVQGYNGHVVVWQFGTVPGAYSSLIVKLPNPNRRLTLILLANSDGLSAPFALENGDVTASLFARVFLRLYAI
jgi:CubicO group peptidase (beta-lactamase class C family)